MSKYLKAIVDGREARVKKPAAGQPALITDYGTLDEFIALHEEYYEEKRAEFYDSLPTDEDLPKKAKRWASQARTFMGLAHALKNYYPENENYYRKAVEIADRVTKDSAIRVRNLDLHYKLLKQEEPENPEKLDRIYREVQNEMNFFTRAMTTQSMLMKENDRKTGGADGIELEKEKKASARADIKR